MKTRLPLDSVLWAKTAPPGLPTPPLDGNADADVAIVGAGYCGLTAALHLAAAGRSVVVVEAEEPGFGGSGRNNGHCVPDWTWQQPSQIDARFGARGDRVNNLQGDAADLVFSLIRDHQIECEAVQSGTLTVVRRQKNVAAQQPGVGSDLGAVELKLEPTVKIQPQNPRFQFTHRVSHINTPNPL